MQRTRSSIVGVVLGVLAAGAHAQLPCPTVTPSPDWKSALAYPDDAFRADDPASGGPGWVKFVTLTCDTDTIYYQDSVKYAFHYDFATNVLDPFLGFTLQQFDAVTLFETGREALLGAVVYPPLQGFPPSSSFPEIGVQLVSQDPLDPQLVVDVVDSVRTSFGGGPTVKVFYFPTFEQQAQAQLDAAFFLQNGIEVSSSARWLTGNACYSTGWALGRLVFVPATDIDAAFTSGALKPTDILLTDGIPASVPLVAGIATLAPSYPNSHVAILASTFGVPFAFLGDPADAAKALELAGRNVVLRVFEDTDVFSAGGCDVSFIDVEHLPPARLAQLLALKDPPPLQLSPVTPFGSYYASTDGLAPADIRFFGGKAANFGFLRRAIPGFSPVSLALSFDLWEEYLQQTMPSGNTLRQDIDAVLAQHTYPPADPAAFAADMQALRDLIDDDSDFTAVQRANVVAALTDPQFGFTTDKLRFRSSTNVEDSEQFTGAGLYDSRSGCLLDDLDADTTGPSLCDPTEPKEKGVFRAIRKVFASFYNDNAVLERLRHGVDESEVGMAVLVHHNFPDPIEAANGVASLDRTGLFTELSLVTQLGAVSVTNPEGNAIPEEVSVTIFGQTPSLNVVTSSSLVQLGDTVMNYPADYAQLTELLLQVAARFELETGKSGYVLDFEYKLMAPGGAVKPAGGLVVKQVRELPQPDTTPSIVPFLVNAPSRYRLLQGRFGDVFANHRLKSDWRLSTKDLWLDSKVTGSRGFLDHLILEHNDGCEAVTDGGPVRNLDAYQHSFDVPTSTSIDAFRPRVARDPRRLELSIPGVGVLVSEAESPVQTLGDLGGFDGVLNLVADYDSPVPTIGFDDLLTTTLTDTVQLAPVWTPGPNDTYREHVFVDGAVTIATSYWLQPVVGVCAGCIQPLSRWGSTTITGLTTDPLVLTDPFAMSYEAGQHNFTEWFLFEPRLDPGVGAAQLAELELADVGLIHVRTFFGAPTITYLSPSGCPPPTAPPPGLPKVPRWAAPAGPKKGL